MRRISNLLKSFWDDQDGAAMIEYTVLISLITIALIVVIGLVATQLLGNWNTLLTALGGTPAT